MGTKGKTYPLRLILESHVLWLLPYDTAVTRSKLWATACLSRHKSWRGICKRTSKIKPLKNNLMVHLSLDVHLSGRKDYTEQGGQCACRSDPSSSTDTQFCFVLNLKLSKFCKNDVGNLNCTQWPKHSNILQGWGGFGNPWPKIPFLIVMQSRISRTQGPYRISNVLVLPQYTSFPFCIK